MGAVWKMIRLKEEKVEKKKVGKREGWRRRRKDREKVVEKEGRRER